MKMMTKLTIDQQDDLWLKWYQQIKTKGDKITIVSLNDKNHKINQKSTNNLLFNLIIWAHQL